MNHIVGMDLAFLIKRREMFYIFLIDVLLVVGTIVTAYCQETTTNKCQKNKKPNTTKGKQQLRSREDKNHKSQKKHRSHKPGWKTKQTQNPSK